MSRYVSLNARAAGDAAASAEVEVVLVIIEHPALDFKVRLSSDNAERLSLEPLTYGTRSTWRTPDGKPFEFIMMGCQLPDDTDDAPSAGSLVLELHDQRLADLLRSTTVPAIVHMALVLANTPNLVEAEFIGMQLDGAEIAAGDATLSFGLKPITVERYPADRMTKEQFPGVHP